MKSLGLSVSAFADVFIIPNHAGPFSTMALKDYARETYKKICAYNGISKFDEEENLIQLWFTSEELGSDNLVRHGFSFDIDGIVYHAHLDWEYERLPLQMVNVKEGETFQLNITNCMCTVKDKASGTYVEDIPVDIHLTCTARQLEYRYRNFGTFEDTLRQVTA